MMSPTIRTVLTILVSLLLMGVVVTYNPQISQLKSEIAQRDTQISQLRSDNAQLTRDNVAKDTQITQLQSQNTQLSEQVTDLNTHPSHGTWFTQFTTWLKEHVWDVLYTAIVNWLLSFL